MILFCPYCGRELQRAIEYGLTSCENCRRIFDSSPYNRMLSVAWQVRRQNIQSPEFLIQHYSVEPVEAEFVFQHVVEECCSHEDFIKILDESNVSKNWC